MTAALADLTEAERTNALVRPPILDRGVYEPVHADTVRSELCVRWEAIFGHEGTGSPVPPRRTAVVPSPKE